MIYLLTNKPRKTVGIYQKKLKHYKWLILNIGRTFQRLAAPTFYDFVRLQVNLINFRIFRAYIPYQEHSLYSVQGHHQPHIEKAGKSSIYTHLHFFYNCFTGSANADVYVWQVKLSNFLYLTIYLK